MRPVADRELAPAGRHDGAPGAGGEALAAGALVSEHRGARGLVRTRTRAPRVLRLGRAREGAGALGRSFFSSGGSGAGFNERRCATWSSPSGVSGWRRFWSLRFSRAIVAGILDLVPDVRLWRDPGPPYRLVAGSPHFPPRALALCAVGLPLRPSFLLLPGVGHGLGPAQEGTTYSSHLSCSRRCFGSPTRGAVVVGTWGIG